MESAQARFVAMIVERIDTLENSVPNGIDDRIDDCRATRNVFESLALL